MKQVNNLGVGNGFKKTVIGEIPVDWEIVSLKDIAARSKYSFVDGPFGSNLKTIHYVDKGIPIIQSQVIISGKFIPDNKYFVTELKAKELERSLVFPGDIIIAKIGINFGASATIPNSYKVSILSGNTMKITPNNNRIDTEYLQHQLHYLREIKAFDRIVSITAQPAITLKGTKRMLIALPTLDEQRKISEILSVIDETFQKLSEVIKKTKQFKKGMMRRLLTQGIGHTQFRKTEIGTIPAEWEVATLADVAVKSRYAFVDGPFGSNLKTIHYTKDGVPVIQSQSITSGKFIPDKKYFISEAKARELERSSVYPGDIVIVKIGTCGASATIPSLFPKAILSGNTMKITPDKQKIETVYLQSYLHFLYEMRYFNKLLSITAQPAITLREARKIKIPLPPLFEQQQISAILSSIDEELAQSLQYQAKLGELKKALMRVLLTGKVRVKV